MWKKRVGFSNADENASPVYFDLELEKQQKLGWGDAVVEMVSKDLRRAFPETKGFSAANVWRMRQFYFVYTQAEFLAQVVRETKKRNSHKGWSPFLERLVPETTDDEAHTKSILSQAVRELAAADPWGHHVLLLGRIKAVPELLYYVKATAQ